MMTTRYQVQTGSQRLVARWDHRYIVINPHSQVNAVPKILDHVLSVVDGERTAA